MSTPNTLSGLATYLADAASDDPDITVTKVSLGEVVDQLGGSAHAPVIFTLALPMVIPMPPGIPTVAGLLIALMAILWLIGREGRALPDRVSRARVGARRLATWIARLDRWLDPLSGPPKPLTPTARRLAAFVIVWLGILMALPVPFVGNIPPAIAVCTLTLADIDHSPRLWFIGMVLSVLALALAAGFGYGLLQVGTAIID